VDRCWRTDRSRACDLRRRRKLRGRNVWPHAGRANAPHGPAEFNTAMIHFYRGEVQRSNTWRNRLDTTTNWAVLTAGATLSFVFSSPTNPHFVIPINSILVAIFLLMEARRYRYYEIWSSRVRIIETDILRRCSRPKACLLMKPGQSIWRLI